MTSNGDDYFTAARSADGLIVCDDGSVRFSSKRKKELARYFAIAGINIDTIKTKDDYLAAREAASPYFLQWLESIVKQGEMTLERQLVIAILRDDREEEARLRTSLDTKSLAR